MIIIILFFNKYTFNNRMKQIFDIFSCNDSIGIYFSINKLTSSNSF